MDEEAPPLIAEKIGWQTKRLGLEKTRIPGCGRRVICWDEEKMRHLAIRYGFSLDNPLSQENPSQPSQLSLPDVEPRCEGSCEGICETEEPSQDFEANREGCDSGEGSWKDMEEKLGMSISDAITVWNGGGKPVIHLGPGENCFDLEKLLSNRDINERHLTAIREWLENRQK